MRDEGAEGDPPECLACGAWCFSTLASYVSVTGDDNARLGDDAAGVVSWDSNHAYMRLEDGHCAALRVDPIERRFVCTMYETRPQVCRDLARGPGACAGERQSKEERPLLALHGR